MAQLFPELNEPIEAQASGKSGILPAQLIRAMIGKQIKAVVGLQDNQIQPASLDLRLGATAYHIPASFLPSVKDGVIKKLNTLRAERMDIRAGEVFRKGQVYLVPLMESLVLPRGIAAFANPKSSTGRIDVFTRVISDYGTEFDKIPSGYKGPLYIEIGPRSFPIIVRAGSRLAQIRFSKGGDKRTKGADSDSKIRKLHEETGLVVGKVDEELPLLEKLILESLIKRQASTQDGLPLSEDPIPKDLVKPQVQMDGGLPLSVDLVGDKQNGLIGYRAKENTPPIDIDRAHALDITEFWEILQKSPDRRLILDPERFYILASREAVVIPPSHAAEMEPISPRIGEFRVHYAGFFDPGFGTNGTGSHAVLEVRSREVPFMLEHGQMIGRLMYKPLLDMPDLLYGGAALGSNYQGQGLRLSKHFKQAD